MKAIFGRTLSCSDAESKEAVYVNNCGFYESPDCDINVCRKNGRLDYQLLCVGGGTLTIYINDNEIVLKRGDIFIYPPHMPQIYTMSRSKDGKLFWVHFSGYAVSGLLSKCSLSPGRVYCGASCGIVEDAIHKITDELHKKKNCYEINCAGILISLMALLTERKSEHRGSCEKLLKARIDMEHNFSVPRKIEEYAALCNLSVSHFIRAFYAEYGVTPKVYLTRVRINNAKELLLYTDMKIGEIGKICGYTDPLYFSRAFRKAVGISPEHYRQN